MDCRTCQPSLIDLLHGELALEAAQQARAHIAHCANCKGALDKLAQGLQHAQQLPLSDPPQAVTARLLLLAEEQARRSAALRKPRGAQTVWQALLDFIGRFAAARQVGMVTIMMLIVAVGLWSLPQLQHTPVAAGGTVVHPDESGEAAPSTGVEPAQPLDLKVDLRAGRIRSREGMAAAPEGEPAAPVAQAPPEPEPEGAMAAERAARSARTGAALDKDRALARSSSGFASARRAPAAPKPAAAPPAPFPRNAAVKGAGPRARDLGQLGGAEELLDEAKSSAATERRVAPAAASAPARPSTSDGVHVVVQSAQTGSGAPAKKAKSGGDAQLRLALDDARATAASRGCSAALPEYERVVRDAPGSADAGEALIEMARCAQARGDAQRARALLTRAAQIPQVARRASDLLGRVPQATGAKADKAESLSDMNQ